MTTRKTAIGLCTAAAMLFAVAPAALASPAGSEYLPKIPHSGSNHSSNSGSGGREVGTATSTLPDDRTSAETTTQDKREKQKGKKKRATGAPVSGQSGGGDGSDSVLLNPVVLVVLALLVALLVWVLLRRRSAGAKQKPTKPKPGQGPTSPGGDVTAGPDAP